MARLAALTHNLNGSRIDAGVLDEFLDLPHRTGDDPRGLRRFDAERPGALRFVAVDEAIDVGMLVLAEAIARAARPRRRGDSGAVPYEIG